MKKTLSNEEIATLCLELSYLYHGGKVSSLDLEEMAKDGDPGGVLTGIDYEHCKGCGICAEVCPFDAITMKEGGQV